MSEERRVGVVLLNWNSADYTIPCIKSLYALIREPWRIVVLDNASEDTSLERIESEFPRVTILRSDRNLGFSAGNNVGIRRLLDEGAEYVWVLNNDTIVDPHCLEHLLQVAEADRGIAALGAKILYAAPPHRIWYAGAWLNRLTFGSPHHGAGNPSTFGPKGPVQVDFISGCSMLITRKALQEVGLFDELFFAYSEDRDWCIRAQRLGFQLIYVPDAILYHEVSASIRKNTLGSNQGTASPRAHYLSARNSLWIIRKYAQSWYKISAITIRLLQLLGISISMIVLRRWQKLAALWSGLRDGLCAEVGK